VRQDGPVRAVVQRVDGASVVVGGSTVGQIDGPGLLVLVGATHDDTPSSAAALADKVWDLRIFDAAVLRTRLADPDALPASGPREVSASDAGLPVLVVSQFTLYGSTRKGRRPTWEAAAPGDVAAPLVEALVARLRERGAVVATGEFGADMRVSLVNDGPITVIVDV
jgi:D-tyrosyl-tRNA(Tyr) deacylase